MIIPPPSDELNSYYTGIGSRQTPEIWRDVFANIGTFLYQEYGLILRSGGADGADTFFEKARGPKHIYLPSYYFNSRTVDNIQYFKPSDLIRDRNEPIIKQCCPHWDNIKRPNVRNLLLRNICQIVGHDIERLHFSEFVLCWTPNGDFVGGTRYAMACADLYNIPIFNFGNYTTSNYEDDFFDFIEEVME